MYVYIDNYKKNRVVSCRQAAARDSVLCLICLAGEHRVPQDRLSGFLASCENLFGCQRFELVHARTHGGKTLASTRFVLPVHFFYC